MRIPKSSEHERRESQLSQRLNWIPVTDVAMPSLFSLTPSYLEALSRSVSEADHIILSHPYLLPALREVTTKPFWYDAQDVEIDLKREILPPCLEVEDILEATRDVEAQACTFSELILVCSREDAKRLGDLYEAEREKIAIVPNGVDLETISFVTPEKRRKRKQQLGLESEFLVLFLGSWHPPNLQAVEYLIDMAPQMQDISIIILGSVGAAFQDQTIPRNMALAGIVNETEKLEFLNVADAGINPVSSGSGTNLKMLEYCAAGLPVVSTPRGARGLELMPNKHIEVSELDQLPHALVKLKDRWDTLDERVLAARACVEKFYDWKVIVESLALELEQRV
jgi:glycosyltransferase involved in cell wall biosynthesis